MNASLRDRVWTWGGREKPNSISDAEQLLCIMYPAAEIRGFGLYAPDQTADDVLKALDSAGDSVGVPLLLVKVIGEYLHGYVDQSGAPIFSGGSYFSTFRDQTEDLTPDQRALDVVDSYSMSITLMLNVIGFLRGFRPNVQRAKSLHEIDELEALASARLTAAMVGLLRSFTVNTFEADSTPGRILRQNINQSGMADRRVVESLQGELAPIRTNLIRELNIGSGLTDTRLDNPNLLFECGWTWGVVDGAPREVLGETGTQEVGFAHDRPYLYFTSTALDGIEDLFSDRTRTAGLLDDKQLRLSNALQLRYSLTRSYWSKVAMFGHGRWPIEDIPWTTSDGQESDYYSLLVTSMAVQDLISRRATDVDLRRVYQILSDLASRGRITRRPTAGDDTSIALHTPGVPLTLVSSDSAPAGPPMGWVASNFAALLLKRTVGVAQLAQTTELRDLLLDLAGQVWEHLQRRRLRSGDGRDLWDQTRDVFPDGPESASQPSWSYTERVVEGLVASAWAIEAAPLRSDQLSEQAAELLNEAEHLYDRELLAGSGEAGESLRDALKRIRLSLERARSVQHERPGTAVSLAMDILRELDKLAAVRLDSVGL